MPRCLRLLNPQSQGTSGEGRGPACPPLPRRQPQCPAGTFGLLRCPPPSSQPQFGLGKGRNCASHSHPTSRSSLAGLPRLRLLSLTVGSEAVPHRELGALQALEELHIYLAPPTPSRFDFQPGEAPRREACLVATGCAPAVSA